MIIIPKLQEGGELPPLASFTSVVQPATQASQPAAKDTSSKTDNKSDKNNIGLLTSSMVDTLMKNGLYSDVNAFLDETHALENDIFSNPFDSSDTTELTKYRKLLGLLPLVTKGYKDLTDATTKTSEKNALNEIAVSSSGSVFVQDPKTGQIVNKRLEDVDVRKTRVLTNADLVNIRQNDPRYALNRGSGLIDIINNSASMTDVMKWMNDVISKASASSYKQSGDMVLPGKGSSVDMKKVQTGMAALQDAMAHVKASINPEDPAVRNAVGATDSTPNEEVADRYAQVWLAQNFGEEGIYKIASETKSNANAIKYAINAIKSFMPANYRTLLQYRAATNLDKNSAEGIDALIGVLAGTSQINDYSLDVSLATDKNGVLKTKTKSPEDELMNHKQSSAEAFAVGEGLYGDHQIQMGGNEAFVMRGVKGTPMRGNRPVGMTTLDGFGTTDFGSVLDMSKATLAGARLNPAQLSTIITNAHDIIGVDLPVDTEALQKGVVRPDLGKLEQLEKVHSILAQKGLLSQLEQAKANVNNGIPIPQNLINQINSVYRQHNLDLLLTSNGTTNLVNYRRFAILSSNIPESAVPTDANMNYLKAVADKNTNKQLQDYIHSLNKNYVPNPKGFFGGDDVYQGTVFVPINKDIMGAIYGSGEKLPANQAAILQGITQHAQEIRPMVKAPNLLNGE